MAACHLLSLSSSNAPSSCPELLVSSNDRRHSSLHCASSSSRFPPINQSSQTHKISLLGTVLRARKSKADSAVSSSAPEVHPESLAPASSPKKARSSRNKAKDKSLLFEGTPDFEFEYGYTMGRVCDRLIEIFTLEKTKEDEWRKLILLSDDWGRIRPFFFKRCRYRESIEKDRFKKANLLSLSDKLQKVDADIEKHTQLLDYVQDNWPELDVIVAGRRKEFSNAFFRHMTLLCETSGDRLDKRDDLARFAAKCLAAVEAHDRALEDDVAVTIAQKKFDNILDSPSLDEACSKIDEFANKKQLDSTLMLFLAKAWAAAKESSTMTDEIKDLMHHLYMVARGHMQRMIPKEIRILQHILAIEDPTKRFGALTEAFSPGDESIEKETDALYTKPARLHKWIKLVLDGYHFNKQSTVIDSARQLMTPQIISRLLQLKTVVEDQFL